MLWSKNTKSQAETLLARLKDFELFCVGEKHLTPEQFRTLNLQLSVSAVEHIGKLRVENTSDGRHLIWTGVDEREHDLGSAENPDISRDYPGFHRTRSLSMGHDMVEENLVIDAPRRGGQITLIKMKDGTTSVAPNYKMALRNAALKVHLKHQFNRLNQMDLWNRFYGHA